MKVLLVNGSPNKAGCTYTALSEVADALNKSGIETGFYWIGREPIRGCIACNQCVTLHKCVFDDGVNTFVEIAEKYDGFVFGSPVYAFSMNGSMSSFLDRVVYSAMKTTGPHPFRFKPAAAVTSARRAGTTATLDQMNKYFLTQQMPVVSSRYMNMVHGYTPEDVRKDEEGMQIMRMLGRNMAWLLKSIEAGKAAGIHEPVQEEIIFRTNFIR